MKVSRGEVDKYMIPWDKWDFGPRIGLAYNWRDKTVFRAGYGIFYGGEENQGGNPNRGESVPFNQSTDLARPAVPASLRPIRSSRRVSRRIPQQRLRAPGARLIPRRRAELPELPWCTSGTSRSNTSCRGRSSLELAYVGNHQAHQLFQPDWNACPNLGTTAGD